MRSGIEPSRPGLFGLRLATQLALLLAVVTLTVWFWSRLCRFPSIPWNDMRLAPTIALAQGWPVYPTAMDGTVNTWMYGPLPLLYFWPASWAGSAADALMVAASLNLALTLVPLALVCFAWPVAGDRTNATLGRISAFLLCLAVWPELHYSVHFSDNLAVACGLVGNLVLVRARHARELWIAAFIATAAIACKQIALGIPLAQILWLGITASRVDALRHTIRCVLAGLAIAVAAIVTFGWEGLWFTLVEIPGGIEWAAQPAGRLLTVAPELALHLVLPAVAMLAARHAFARPALLLPALAWMCALPLGLAALLKSGGWTNSIYSFLLWLPATVTTLLTTIIPDRRREMARLIAVVAAAAIATGRILGEPNLTLRPQLAPYREAEQIARRSPNAIWFPLHPLITLYSDRRYYHDEDGMYVRRKAHKRLTPEQAVASLPPAMRTMAFRHDFNDWGIARSMLPPNSRSANAGHWTLWSGVAEKPQP